MLTAWRGGGSNLLMAIVHVYYAYVQRSLNLFLTQRLPESAVSNDFRPVNHREWPIFLGLKKFCQYPREIQNSGYDILTVIRFVWVSATFGTCTVVTVNGTLVEDKMLSFQDECAHFSFNKCPIYTHDGASAKFSTNSHKTDNSAV